MPELDSIVYQLACAVAAPGTPARLIRPDNGPGAVVELSTAAASGQAFMVDLRDGVVVFDLDSTGDIEAAKVSAAHLLTLGCAEVKVSSGRPDHAHWFYVGRPGWRTSDLVEAAKFAGIPANQLRWGARSCRPPLAPHRSGRPVSLIEPATPAEALARLTRRPSVVPLHPKWGQLLLTGSESSGKYRTPGGELNWSKLLTGVALAHVNSGADFVDYAQAAVGSHPVISSKLTASGVDAAANLRRKWDSACELARRCTAEGVIDPELARIRATVNHGSWGGPGGETDRCVYTHLAAVAEQLGTSILGCSERTIALKLGLTQPTVNRAKARLRRRGLLRVVSVGTFGHAGRHQLLPDAEIAAGAASVVAVVGYGQLKDEVDASVSPTAPLIRTLLPDSFDCTFDATPDLFRGQAGLPRAAFATWQATPVEWTTVKVLSALRPGSMKPSSVRNHLKLLLSVGLVDRDGHAGHRWRRLHRPAVDLQRLAGHLGTAGSSELQLLRFERERESVRPRNRPRGTPLVA